MSPSTTPYDGLFAVMPEDIVFRNNVVVDNATSYSNERNIVDIGTYISDATFDATAPALSFATNCYFNPNIAPQFQMGAANGGNYGEKGGTYSFSEWQALSNDGQALNFDQDSLIADPSFVDAAAGDFHLLPTSLCADMGAYAGISAGGAGGAAAGGVGAGAGASGAGGVGGAGNGGDAGPQATSDDSGCGCRLEGSSKRKSLTWPLVAIATLLWRRRRSRASIAIRHGC
jgi:MYXO-CTERM domain-containing protein